MPSFASAQRIHVRHRTRAIFGQNPNETGSCASSILVGIGLINGTVVNHLLRSLVCGAACNRDGLKAFADAGKFHLAEVAAKTRTTLHVVGAVQVRGAPNRRPTNLFRSNSLGVRR